MKTLIRNIAFYTLSLFILPFLLSGVKVVGGFPTLLLGGFILTLLFMFIRPILTILSFPLNLATLGLFSFFINVIILYLLTLFVPNIMIQAFQFTGISFAGFIIPSMSINVFFAYFLSATIVFLTVSILTWITK